MNTIEDSVLEVLLQRESFFAKIEKKKGFLNNFLTLLTFLTFANMVQLTQNLQSNRSLLSFTFTLAIYRIFEPALY